MESQKTQTSQANPEKEEESWRHHAPWFQGIYYGSVVIKQCGRSVSADA